jgi:hypothetical protein
MLGLIIIIFLVLFFVGGAVPGPWYGSRPGPVPGQPVASPYFHGYGYGPYVPGGLGIVLVVVLILVLLGRF